MHKETIVDRIEVLEKGHLQVRRATYLVEDDGKRTLLGYERVAYEPGTDITTEDAKVRDVAGVVWTPEVVSAHKRHLLKRQKA